MDNSLCLRALHSVCIYMGHYIVAHCLLSLLGNLEVDILHMLPELTNLLLCHRKSQLMLRLSQSHPKTPPCAKLFLRGENILHFPACIALRKRAHISVIHRFYLILPFICTAPDLTVPFHLLSSASAAVFYKTRSARSDFTALKPPAALHGSLYTVIG